MSDLYKQRVIEALEALEAAITAALRQIPPDVQTQHWMASKHAPDASAAWDVVQWNYYGRVDCDNAVLAVLSDLVFLSRAAGQLRAVLRETPTHAPDLRLPKSRRDTISAGDGR